jgi:sulfatase maturation enzyme AslB (radical SAM superfamily)
MKERIWCFAPWYNMQFFTYSDTISAGPCCYFGAGFVKLESMPKTEKQVMQIYNSNKFVELRKRLTTGEVSGSPCEFCYERLLDSIRWGTSSQMGMELPKLSFNSSNQYLSLHAKANSSYKAGEALVAHPPLSYYFFLSQRCNLRCIMCGQNHSDPFLAPVNSIIELLRSQGFQSIDQIGLIGGEPFFAKDGLELTHYLANEDLSGANVFITTNGTLLKNEIRSLVNLKNLKLTISLDGGDKETYESIRRTSWGNILENLQVLTSRDVYNSKWDVSVNCCVMKSNICHLDKLVDLAHDFGFGLTFSAISGPEFESENILLYNYLLDDVPDWERGLHNAIEKAGKFGMNNTVVWLELLLRLLITPPKMTREMVTHFWDYGWKARKDIAYAQLNKVYVAKMTVDQKAIDTRYIQDLMFPAKWRVFLLSGLPELARPVVRAFPILRRAGKIVSKLAGF